MAPKATASASAISWGVNAPLLSHSARRLATTSAGPASGIASWLLAGLRLADRTGWAVLMPDYRRSPDRMETTAGSLALVGTRVPADSPLVANLRAAGAVILGKTNLSEWANFRGFPPPDFPLGPAGLEDLGMGGDEPVEELVFSGRRAVGVRTARWLPTNASRSSETPPSRSPSTFTPSIISLSHSH